MRILNTRLVKMISRPKLAQKKKEQIDQYAQLPKGKEQIDQYAQWPKSGDKLRKKNKSLSRQ